MRVISRVCRILIWLLSVFYMTLQGVAILGLLQNNEKALKMGNIDKVYSVYPLMGVSLLMLVAVFLFMVIKRKQYIGLIIGVIAAVGMLIVALDLGRTFPMTVTSYSEAGLSTWKLIWRHIGIAILPILMMPVWLIDKAEAKSQSLRRTMVEKPGYDLSGSALFVDEATESKESIKPHRLKRSLRKKPDKY